VGARLTLSAGMRILVPAHAARALETRDLAGWWIAIDEIFPTLWRRGDIVAMEELLVISPDGRAANRLMTLNPPNPVKCVDASYCSDAPLVVTARLTLKGDLLTVREWKPTTVRIAGDKAGPLLRRIAVTATPVWTATYVDNDRPGNCRAFRTDGKVPTKDGARSDRHDCVLKRMPEQQAKRLALLARKDKAAGEVALLRAVTPCMARKGWRIEVTGR